jgi:hypothetical protein
MPAIVTDLSADELSGELESFFAEHPSAAILEEGRALFDMREARYSVRAEHGRCILQLWSEERNIVRTVTGIDRRRQALRLEVRRFGQARPQMLHILADRDQRTPSARAVARARYLRQVEHLLLRSFPDWSLDSITGAMDLEHGFGPAYVRGLLTRGQSACAVIAAGAEETPAAIDGILTLGLLWLSRCRERAGQRRHVEGLRVIVPEGQAEATRARMGWLNASLARWELWTCDARTEVLTPVETGRNGNLEMRLPRCFDSAAALERLADGIAQALALVPEAARPCVEIRANGPASAALSLHGLEFARVRHGLAAGGFERRDRITFGTGPAETELTGETAPLLRSLTERLFAARQPHASANDPLYRLQPERWLESRLAGDLEQLDPQLLPAPVYRQVPAFAARDRGLLDLLAVTREGRLAILELKADEDPQMVLQGVDYWMRVRQALQQGAFAASGYFPGLALADSSPLLCFVAPALRIHRATATILGSLSPEVDWQLVAIGERWRSSLDVVWRRRADRPGP